MTRKGKLHLNCVTNAEVVFRFSCFVFRLPCSLKTRVLNAPYWSFILNLYTTTLNIMIENKKNRAIAYALGINIFIAIIGGSLIGDGQNWYRNLDKPWYLISFNLFLVVGLIYNLLFAYVLYRLFSQHFEAKDDRFLMPIYSVVALMAVNESGNYFFMGLQSTWNGFIGMLIFAPFVAFAIWKVSAVDKLGFKLLCLYGLWVIYDIVWTYDLWRMNG